MSNFWKGTISSLFQLTRPTGPNLKDNGGVIELRDATDAAYAQGRCADPTANVQDIVTLGYFTTYSMYLKISNVTGIQSPAVADCKNAAFIFDTSGGAGTLNLPAVAATEDGLNIHIRNVGLNRVVITPNGADTIEGSASYDMVPGDGLIIVYDDSNTDWKFCTEFTEGRDRILSIGNGVTNLSVANCLRMCGVVDTALGAATINLPAGSAAINGISLTFHCRGGNIATITPNGADTINSGQASYGLHSLDSVRIVWENASADWRVVATNAERRTILPKNANYNMTIFDVMNSVVRVDTTGGVINIQLPSVGAGEDGIIAIVKNRVGANNVVLQGNIADGDTVDGAASINIFPTMSATVVYDHANTDWLVI